MIFITNAILLLESHLLGALTNISFCLNSHISTELHQLGLKEIPNKNNQVPETQSNRMSLG